MYTTGPPSPGPPSPGPPSPGPPSPGPLCVEAAIRRRFDGPPAIAARAGHGEHLRAYLSDLVAQYQLALREDLATDRAGHSYGEMAAPLVAELVPRQRPIDLLVLAFANPDVRPGRATATYLSQCCPGNPLAFAICDQGTAAAFTGLRLIAEYARTGGCQRSVLLVVEQAAVPYDAGLAVDLPTAHTAVGLRCELAGPAAINAVRQHPNVSEDRVAGLLAQELSTLTRTAAPLHLITDSYLAARLAEHTPAGPAGWLSEVRVSPAGQPHTGSWWELAGELMAAGDGDRRVVLASYDRQLGYLCLSAVDLTPRP